MMKKDSITAEIKGRAAFQKALRALSEQAQERVRLAITKTAAQLQENIKTNYQKPGTGTVYFRIPGQKYMTIRAGSMDGPPVAFVPGGGSQNLSLQHQASAPGEAPALDTGRLMNSVYINELSASSFEIGTKLDYAFWLEHGTRKIAPRPNWVPETEKTRKQFESIMRQTIARAIKEAGR